MPTLGTPTKTAEVINKFNFNFKKKFGQNFLVDKSMLEKIISAADISEDDCVLEIGPGIGTMTQYLASQARKVIVVEIDENLIPILKETLSEYDNVEIINNDILKVDIKKLCDDYNDGRPIKVVANLPYYITTPIIEKIIDFSEVRQFIDTPVKRYSSGMFVRLAFSLSIAVWQSVSFV